MRCKENNKHNGTRESDDDFDKCRLQQFLGTNISKCWHFVVVLCCYTNILIVFAAGIIIYVHT